MFCSEFGKGLEMETFKEVSSDVLFFLLTAVASTASFNPPKAIDDSRTGTCRQAQESTNPPAYP
jgi:hypothetical protein